MPKEQQTSKNTQQASNRLQEIVQRPAWPIADSFQSHHLQADSSTSSLEESSSSSSTAETSGSELTNVEPTRDFLQTWPAHSDDWNAIENSNQSIDPVDLTNWYVNGTDDTIQTQTSTSNWPSFSPLDVTPRVPNQTRPVNLASQTGDLLFLALNRGASTSTSQPEEFHNSQSSTEPDSWGWEKPLTPKIRTITMPRSERTNQFIDYANGDFQVNVRKAKTKRVEAIALKSALKKVISKSIFNGSSSSQGHES